MADQFPVGQGPPAPPVGVHDLAGQSKYYIVIITSSRWGTVQAWLPDSVQLIVKSSWGPVVGNIENALANWIGPQIGTPGTAFFSKRLTAQEWRGMEPLELILPLHFFATQDASNDVVEPIKRLIKMALPVQINENLFGLRAPGPVPEGAPIPGFPGHTIGGADKANEDRINVYIGNFLTLKEVFIATLPSIEFKGTLSTDGLPMQGLCTVVFRTVYSPTAQDVETYLGAIQGTPTTGGRPEVF